MKRLAITDWRFWVRFVGALALILVAFGHQPLSAGSRLPDASAYAFPDGSVPIICVTLPGDQGSRQIDHGMPCGACLVSGHFVLPEPAELTEIAYERTSEPVIFASNEPVLIRAAFPPAAPPRAPPSA